MSSGKVHKKWHDRFNLPMFAISLLFGWGIFFITRDFILGILSFASMFAGFRAGILIESDLDLIGITSSEGIAMRESGIFGMMWVMYWIPYGYIMSNCLNHRSLFSHFPGIATLIRMIYLSWWMIAGYCYFFVVDIYLILPLLSSFIGLTISDTIHYFLDIVS